MYKINTQGIKDNLQHIAGIIIGALVLKSLGVRFSKDDRGNHWFSTVAANLAADGNVKWLPYVMVYKL